MNSFKYLVPVVSAFLVVEGAVAQAQVSGPPAAPFTAARPAADTSQFLAQSPNGGGTLVSQVRNLLTSDKTSLAAIMALVPSANAEQQASIADGLWRAAQAYLKTDGDFAGDIQRAAVGSGFPELTKAYASLSGDAGTGSTGGGGGGGGGGAGGGPTTDTTAARSSSSTPQTTGTSPTRNNSPNLLTGGTASSANASFPSAQ